jgi:hypothetical protein
LVEELNNKDIDKTLADTKLENERETTVKKSSKHKKKESPSKSAATRLSGVELPLEVGPFGTVDATWC